MRIGVRIFRPRLVASCPKWVRLRRRISRTLRTMLQSEGTGLIREMIMWEDRSLRDITEADLRQIIDAQLEEHLQLEYKSALYENNHQGSKESLLDICMFANAGGGILLLGISEQRDAGGQPTGLPDPNAQLGLGIP